MKTFRIHIMALGILGSMPLASVIAFYFTHSVIVAIIAFFLPLFLNWLHGRWLIADAQRLLAESKRKFPRVDGSDTPLQNDSGRRAAQIQYDTTAPTAESIVAGLEYYDPVKPYLLAFSAMVDSRPLYVQSALLAVRFPANNWRLLHAYRHPNSQFIHRRRWDVSKVCDMPHRGDQDYDHRPTEAEMETFLRETWWEFRIGARYKGFHLLRGEVYSETWQEALGYKPSYAYPSPST